MKYHVKRIGEVFIWIKKHYTKPQAKQEDKKIAGWRCKICGYVYEGSELPADFTCPLCGHPAEDFEPIYEEK